MTRAQTDWGNAVQLTNVQKGNIKTKKYSSRMHTAHSSPWRGSLFGGSPWQRPPASGERPPLDRDPLDRDHPLGSKKETALKGTWNQAARQEVTSYRDPPVDRQTPLKILPCPKLCLRTVINARTQTVRYARTDREPRPPEPSITDSNYTQG